MCLTFQVFAVNDTTEQLYYSVITITMETYTVEFQIYRQQDVATGWSSISTLELVTATCSHNVLMFCCFICFSYPNAYDFYSDLLYVTILMCNFKY